MMKKSSTKKKTALEKKKVIPVPGVLGTPSNDAQCPECHARINIDGGEIGDYLECETCFAEFTIATLEPPKLEMVDEEK